MGHWDLAEVEMGMWVKNNSSGASWSLEASSNLPDCWGISRLRRWAFLRLWSCWWWETMHLWRAHIAGREVWWEKPRQWCKNPGKSSASLYRCPEAQSLLLGSVFCTPYEYLPCARLWLWALHMLDYLAPQSNSLGRCHYYSLLLLFPRGHERRPTQMAKLRSKLGCIAREP